MSHVAIVEHGIDVAALQARVAGPDAGAVSLFVGTVRDVNAGRAVSGIEYSAYRSMALRELGAIATEVEREFNGARVAVEHRIGELAVGEASVVVAVSHAHRGMAIDGCRQVIEELKRRVPIWKCEHYVDGTREWVHAGTGGAVPAHGVAPEERGR
jgi:molybdopterin synthase catalytic subunit